MRVAVVGAGGREHALAWALARTAEVVVVPGNAGIARALPCAASLAAAGPVDLVVVGPEAPLVDGLADRLRAEGVLVVGPGAEGARLEGSKAFMKAVAHRAEVPTAASAVFTAGQEADAEAFLGSLPAPWVVKADGLAAGKGVLVTRDLDEAVADVRAKLSGEAFGAAGTTVVVEEGMVGPELSVLVLCDGRVHPDGVVVLPPARDHKRAGDGDTGPNTGGMGAFSPVAGLPDGIADLVRDRFVLPTLDALGVPYMGVLYAGLMLTAGGPRLVEFNVRMGDPEAQVVLPRLGGDVAALFASAAAGEVDPSLLEVLPDACVGVVLAAPGYPDAPRTGGAIDGVHEALALGAHVFAAGVAERDGRLVTAGGRVHCVVGTGPDVAAARAQAYAAADAITYEGGRLARTDIAAS